MRNHLSSENKYIVLNSKDSLYFIALMIAWSKIKWIHIILNKNDELTLKSQTDLFFVEWKA